MKMSKSEWLIEEGIIKNEKPYRVMVSYFDYFIERDSHAFKIQIIDEYNNYRRFVNIFLMTIELITKYGFSGISKTGESGQIDKIDLDKMISNLNSRKAFYECVRRAINVVMEYEEHWDKLKSYGFEDLNDNLKNNLIFKSNLETDYKSGISTKENAKKLYEIINDMQGYFDNVTYIGTFLSSDLSYDENLATLKFLKRNEIINRESVKIRIIYENLDTKLKSIRIDSVEDKTESVSDRTVLFQDIKLPYDSQDIVFVIMPFSKEKFEWLGEEKNPESLRSFIAEKSGCKCVTVADDARGGNILNKIYTHLKYCKFTIADIASLNPNVLYELGLAHSLGKDVIPICSKAELSEIEPKIESKELFGEFLRKVFDLNHNTILDYETEDELRTKLGTAIEQTLKTLNL